jgi:hypothetical protein
MTMNGDIEQRETSSNLDYVKNAFGILSAFISSMSTYPREIKDEIPAHGQ